MRASIGVAVALALATIGLAALDWSAQAQSSCPVEQSRIQNTVSLINGVPQVGMVRPTSPDFGSLDLTQYTFEVPNSSELEAGKARLVINLNDTASRDNDIDLLVRIGEPVDVFLDADGKCRVHADYLSREPGGEEQITIDGSSDPPLKAAIYYIAVLNFEFDRPGPQDYQLVANLTPPPPPPCPSCIPLDPNHPQSGEIAKGPVVEVERQYAVSVLLGSNLLGLLLQGEGSAELNLYVRVGRPVAWSGDQLISDFALLAPGSFESLVLFGAQLKPGSTYFLAVENRTSEPQKFTITAALAPHVRSLAAVDLGATLAGETGLPTLNADLSHLLDQQTHTRDGHLGLTQYRLIVPQGAKALHVKLTSAKGAPLRLHLAREAPVGVSEGQVRSDISTGEATATQTLNLTGKLFQPAIYYLAIEGLGDQATSYMLQVTLDGLPPQRPAISTSLGHGPKK